MGGKNLSPELQEELKAARSAEELERIAEQEDYELSDEMLEGVAGGGDICPPLQRCQNDGCPIDGFCPSEEFPLY